MDIVEVLIETDITASAGNALTLFRISSIIKEYLDEHNVILYCYCDNQEIKKVENKAKISHQAYRSLLFSRLFEKKMNPEYTSSTITIRDEINGDHYIHLITRTGSRYNLDILTEELLMFQNS